MALQIKVGTVATVRFALYQVDGTTKRTAGAGDVDSILTIGAAEAAEVVTVTELVGLAGEYVATFTPAAAGTYHLSLRDTAFDRDITETLQVALTSLDDVGFAMGLGVVGLPA